MYSTVVGYFLGMCKAPRSIPMCKWMMLSFFFFFWFFFSELGTEPRALRFLGKRFITELNPQPLNDAFLMKVWK